MDCQECNEAGFTIKHGVIANPGKFEGEPIETHHAYHIYLDGFADDDNGDELLVGAAIMWIDEQGFVNASHYDTEEEAKAAFDKMTRLREIKD